MNTQYSQMLHTNLKANNSLSHAEYENIEEYIVLDIKANDIYG